jgi:hypothetical protein
MLDITHNSPAYSQSNRNTKYRSEEALLNKHFSWKLWQLTTEGLLWVDPPSDRIGTACNQRVQCSTSALCQRKLLQLIMILLYRVPPLPHPIHSSVNLLSCVKRVRNNLWMWVTFIYVVATAHHLRAVSASVPVLSQLKREVTSYQCSLKVCRKADRPSITIKIITVNTAHTAKHMAVHTGPSGPAARIPGLNTMTHSISESSVNTRTICGSYTCVAFLLLFLWGGGALFNNAPRTESIYTVPNSRMADEWWIWKEGSGQSLFEVLS